MGLHFGKTYNGKPLACNATVWTVEPKEKCTVVKLTTSKKRAEGWEVDFSSKCLFLGEAKDLAKGLREKDRITINSAEVAIKWNAEKGCNDINIMVFGFEMADGSDIPKPNTFVEVPEGMDDELPFV